MEKFVLIDTHAVVHRAYHALPPLTTPQGEPIQAVYGFATILLRILKELRPDYIAAAFDLPGPTFRHIAYERYKAKRPETPSDLGSQFPKTEELLRAFGICVYKKEGYEADDIIGAIVKKVSKEKGVETIVVTGDLDALQLVGPRVKVYAMKKGISETVVYDENMVLERYGLKPSQLVDFKGFKGDPSDNIPGVKGIGEKTAADLIKTYSSIEGVYKSLKKGAKKIPASLLKKLEEGEKDAYFSRELATINAQMPLEFSLAENAYENGAKNQTVKEIFRKFGFFSIIKRLEEEEQKVGGAEKRPATLPFSENRDRVSVQAVTKEGDFLRVAGGGVPADFGIVFYEGGFSLVSKTKKEVLVLDKSLFKKKAAQKFFSSGSFFVFGGKSILRLLHKEGVKLGGILFDLEVASQLTNTAAREGGYAGILRREFGRAEGGDLHEEFGCFFELVQKVRKRLEEQKLEKVFTEFELPLIPVLAAMEERGIAVDTSFLKKLSRDAKISLDKKTAEVYKLAGVEFNINSPKQLSVILFEKLGMSNAGLKKTEKGRVISTRESELEKMRGLHPIIGRILEFRELAKLKSTYIDALPKLVCQKTGRVHTTFNQMGAVTGRISSSSPNLQNIPIMSELGREVRRAFVAERGFLLASFDYSQIELRVAAHVADDRKMMDAFKKGLDIHRATASSVYKIPPEDVTPDLRRAAKTLNFGILYGMGAQAFSEATGFSKEEAKKFIENYFTTFSGVADYIARTKQFAEDEGYVETIFGRRRYMPEIHSLNWQMRREAERMAVNAPIQGSAADLVKLAMIRVHAWVRSENLENKVRMLLQVHDELLFEIDKKVVARAAPKVKSLMEGVAQLKVPLVVDVKVGENWKEQKSVAYA